MSHKQSIKDILKLPVPDPEGHLSLFRLRNLASQKEFVLEKEPHLRQCPICQRQLKQIKEQQKELLQKLPAEPLIKGLFQKKEKSQMKGLLLYRVLPVSVLVLLAMLFLVWNPWSVREQRVKGQLSLRVFLKRGEVVRQIQSGEHLLPNDALRLQLFSRFDGFVRVVGIDKSDKLTSYYPDPANEPDQLAQGIPIYKNQRKTLEGSLTVDEGSSSERLFMIVSKKALSLDDIQRLSASLKKKENSTFQEVESGIWVIAFVINV